VDDPSREVQITNDKRASIFWNVCAFQVVQTAGMVKNKSKRNPKTVLKLPDLEQSKSAIVKSLTKSSLKRIDRFGLSVI
jgi:hypothetical protein